jgi:peptidoglycan/LPS O-acetylase OafA/YrhL
MLNGLVLGRMPGLPMERWKCHARSVLMGHPRRPSERRLPLSHYIPALDGVRGAAIALVVLFHAFPGWLPGGFIGVDVFFVLSGYLTASGLLRERAETGGMAVGAFLRRRVVRLAPGLVVLLLADLTYEAIARGDVDGALIDGALVLAGLANWSLALGLERPGLLAHCWTVSLEQQFYLLAPALTRVLAWRWRLSGLLMLGIVVALAIWRLVLAQQGASPLRLFNGLDTRLGALLIGMLLAGLEQAGGRVWRLAWESATVLGPLAGVSLLGAAAVLDWSALGARFCWFEAVALAAALVVAAAVAPRPGALQRLLALAPLRRLGVVSYGLFLWHFPLIWIVAGDPTRASASRLALALALSLGAAQVSRSLIERPLIAWDRRAPGPAVAQPSAAAP